MAAVAFDAVTTGAGDGRMALITCETELTASLIDTCWPNRYSDLERLASEVATWDARLPSCLRQ